MKTLEIKRQLNDMRTTLKAEEAKLLDSLNHIMGCEMLCERLMNEVDMQDDIILEEAHDEARETD